MPHVLIAWTVLVWAGRVRNVLSDDGSAVDLVVPVGLLVLAAAALVGGRRARRVLAAVTVGVWAIRLPMVSVHDHPVGFKVVHVALAVVSIGLAVGAWRSLDRRLPVSSRLR